MDAESECSYPVTLRDFVTFHYYATTAHILLKRLHGTIPT
jgi:hypothetical protein